MSHLDQLKEKLICLTASKGYPEELGALMAAQLSTEHAMERMITYLTHVDPPSAEDMVDEMLAICADRDFWMEKKKSEYYQQKYNQMLWEEKSKE